MSDNERQLADYELPGMWEQADLMGGATDCDHTLLDDCPMPDEDQPEGESYVCPAGHQWRSVGDGWVPDPYPGPYLSSPGAAHSDGSLGSAGGASPTGSRGTHSDGADDAH